MKLSELIEVLKDNSYKIGNFKTCQYYKENKDKEVSVGVYIRRSKKDKDSIEDQTFSAINILTDNFGIDKDNIKTYKDNGVSGTSDKRIAYLELKKDLDLGIINTVVVVNVDRFGRLTENLLRDIYPNTKIKYLFISIDDLLINSYQNRENFLDKIHDADNYAALTSRKIRRVLVSKMKRGTYISSKAPYGYEIVQEGGNRSLVIGDAFKAEIVKKIFLQYASGKSLGDIIKFLKNENVNSPTGKEYWSKSTIKSILQNPIYKGYLYQGRFQKQSYINAGEGKQVKKIDEDEWIFGGKCPAIVEESVFDFTNELLQQNRVVRTGEGERKLFTGLIKCGDCGASLIYRKKSKSYQCSASLKAPYKCTSHLISECDLNKEISPKIRKILSKVDETILDSVKAKLNVFDANSLYKMELNEIDKDIDRLLDDLVEVDKNGKYAHIITGKINKKIMEYEEKKEAINKRIEENNIFNEKVDKHLKNLANDIDKNNIYRLFLKEIRVYDSCEIEIDWRI